MDRQFFGMTQNQILFSPMTEDKGYFVWELNRRGKNERIAIKTFFTIDSLKF